MWACSGEDKHTQERTHTRSQAEKTEGNLASAATARPGLERETPVCQSGAMATLPLL